MLLSLRPPQNTGTRSSSTSCWRTSNTAQVLSSASRSLPFLTESSTIFLILVSRHLHLFSNSMSSICSSFPSSISLTRCVVFCLSQTGWSCTLFMCLVSHFFLTKPPHWPSGKASASRAEEPRFESHLHRNFLGVESYQWLKNWHSSGYPAWHYRVSAGTGRPGVSILWLGEMKSLICNFYFSVAAREIVWADPSLRYTRILLGR